jgi:carbamoyl-phosphate synthase large subunit
MPGAHPTLAVLVTGVGGGGHGEQILKALRLSRIPLRIIGADMSPYSSGLQRVDHPYLLPPASDPDYLETVVELCRHEHVRVLFHGSECELKVFSQHRARLRALGLFLPINPPEVLDLCMDKVRTYEFLANHGFAVPPFRKVRTPEDALTFGHFPAILKPSIGGGGSANVHLVQDPQEMDILARQLLSIYPEFVVQAYVGTPDAEYTVGVLSDMEGNLLHSIAVRRYILSALSNRIKVPNRSSQVNLGRQLAVSSGVSQGEIGFFPDVTGPCEEIARVLGACGPLNIQCRLVDGKIYVLEINPRFSGTTSLRALVGFNEPEILIRKYVLGEDIQPRFPYEQGIIMRGLEETFVKNPNYPIAKDLAKRSRQDRMAG